jgi:hypothetical protein
MEGERSPVIEEVVGGEKEVSRQEETLTGSSSRDASSDKFGYCTEAQGKESETVDPHESSRSYDFGASTVTIGRISQLETLGYFAKGSTCEPGEEVVPEPADDEAIIFEEFFTAGLRMSPQPVLADILVKFHMRLHQLTLNSLTQLSKYFRAVMSFSGEPSSDGFAKR